MDHSSRRRTWCCSFAVPPSSPDNPSSTPHNKPPHRSRIVGRIDPRRILSPGRVSPVDSVQDVGTHPSPTVHSATQLRSHSFRAPLAGDGVPATSPESCSGGGVRDGFDVRMSLRGKNGGCMVLELNSGVLCANSEVFAGLIEDFKKGFSGSGSSRMCRIEVPDVENLGVFRETIELMFEDDVIKRLTNIGVFRSIDVLEVIYVIKRLTNLLKCMEALPNCTPSREEDRAEISENETNENLESYGGDGDY